MSAGDGPRVDRRNLLKILGAATLATPGLAALDDIVGDLPDAEAAAVNAGRVRLGGAAVRPPSIPLVVNSPYLSTWLPSTKLTGATPQFWTGAPRGFAGLVRIDGRTYIWAGQPKLPTRSLPVMRQTSVTVTATRSIFTFAARGIQLTAEWLSPIEPGDVKRQSMPFSLLTVSVTSTDGRSHHVQVYTDLTGEWAATNPDDEVSWQLLTSNGDRSWVVRLADAVPVSEDAQMAQWGSIVFSTPNSKASTYQADASTITRTLFATVGRLADSVNRDYRAVAVAQPTFAFASDLGRSRGGSVTFAIGHVRTPLISYGTSGTPLMPLWTRYWSRWEAMLRDFLSGAAATRQRATRLDHVVQASATRAGGPGYSAMCALALRQTYGGCELAIGPSGRPWLLLKEISSGGGVNTVDIFDQAFLAWLWLDPELIPMVMEPILDWSASAAWQNSSAWGSIASYQASGTKYCLHNLGYYPVAAGAVPGVGEQMPIEESAGMLIMAAAYARKVGVKKAKPFLKRWQSLWEQWADYLQTQVPTPALQLTTDDWVTSYRTLSASVNLGIKAIIGLAAAAQIEQEIGETVKAATYANAATTNVGPWVQLSLDPGGGHLNLQQGLTGSWSTLYNAFYEVVIGVELVPDEIIALQAAFYETRLTRFGLPLQTNTPRLTKTEWPLFMAAWLNDYGICDQLINRSTDFINQTPNRVPYPDRYDTVSGTAWPGIKAHPTLGAVFALLVAEGLPPSAK